MGKDADELFLEIAQEKRLLAAEQAELCSADQAKLAEMGYSRTMAQIVREKELLTVEQITEIRREMAKRGVLPRVGGYELISKLGEGGMGAVYKARQIALDRVVALKVLPAELGRNRQYIGRFEREARLAAKVAHPNAVQVFQVGEDSGRHYIAMEFIDGSDAAKELAQGPMEEKRALEIIRGVAQALAVAHEKGIVHRDIKPGNIMVTSAGKPKLSDLGIAKQVGASGGTLTKTGAAIGTPQYMSPEQCQGAKDIDGRADIYSLGATLYHMVCGKVPFTGATPPGIMHKQVYELLPDPQRVNPNLSVATAALIQRMLEKDRDARFQTCAELIEGVEAALSGTPVALPVSEPEPAAAPPSDAVPSVQLTVPRKPSVKTSVSLAKRLRNPAVLLPLILVLALVGVGLLIPLYLALSENGTRTTPRPAPVAAPKPIPAPAVPKPSAAKVEFVTIVKQAVEKETAGDYEDAKALYVQGKSLAQEQAQRDWIADGLERCESKLKAYRKRVAYEEALKQAEAALGRARGAKSERLWQAVKTAAERAINSGHTDTTEAHRLLAQADMRLPVPSWAKVSQQQIQAAQRSRVPVAKEIHGGGGVTMKLVFIPAGSFMMGSDKGQSDEKPVHRVTLTRGFYIGIYEVTQGQWRALMGDNPAKFKGDQRPVERVSWNDCQEFIRKLNARASALVRLPTEAEWEYACRAGTRTKYYWGDGSARAYAWYLGNSGSQTHPVGQKLPNAFGLYDMSGNVWEWCGDWYDKGYYASSPSRDPKGPASGKYRCLRGWSWSYCARFCRSASRLRVTPGDSDFNYGFRVAVSVSP